jgi:hypothetical protein
MALLTQNSSHAKKKEEKKVGTMLLDAKKTVSWRNPNHSSQTNHLPGRGIKEKV